MTNVTSTRGQDMNRAWKEPSGGVPEEGLSFCLLFPLWLSHC